MRSDSEHDSENGTHASHSTYAYLCIFRQCGLFTRFRLLATSRLFDSIRVIISKTTYAYLLCLL